MGSGRISRETRRPYYRVFVPHLSADNDVLSEKLEDLVDCKGRTLSDEELANLKAAQVFIKRIMPYLCLYNQLFALFYYVFKFLTL